MNKESRLAGSVAATTNVVRGKQTSGIRTLVRVVLAAVVAGSLGTTLAAIFWASRVRCKPVTVCRGLGAPQATDGVPCRRG